MTEEEMIRQIAEPILKQLEKIEKELGNHRMPQLPQIKFVKDKTTPRLIQFHTLKNAVNPPFLGGFLFSGTVAA